MEAKRLLDAAPFAPDILKTLKQAFEEAWLSLRQSTPLDRVDDTRVSLAHVLIARAAAGDHDRESLKEAAVQAVQKHPPRVSPMDP